MKEIVCQHRWGIETESGEWDYKKNSEIAKRWRECRTCRELWRTGAPEPRVVLARLEESLARLDESLDKPESET